VSDDKKQDIKDSLQSFWHKLAVGDEQNPAWLTTFWNMLRVFWQKLTVGDDQHKPWASNPIVVVLSLIFLFPVGVWFLFWFTTWNRQVKWSLFSICGLVFLFRMSGVDTDAIRETARETQRLAEIRQAAEAADIEAHGKKETNAVNRAGDSVDRLKLPVGRGDALEASEINALFAQNEVSANAKYKGKTLVVQGPVHRVTQSGALFGPDKVTIWVGNRGLVAANLSFKGSENIDLRKLKNGDWVQVKGVCAGPTFTHISIDDCEFILAN
jgi:hypothetical protein